MTSMSNEVIAKSKSLIKIEPLDKDLFVFQWMVTRRCQFDCSYCPDFWHDRKAPSHSLSMLKLTATRIIQNLPPNPDRRFLLNITGGEPTTNKNLILFLKWFGKNYSYSANVSTNGTKNVDYYKELIKHSSVFFTIHSEFANERKIITNIIETHKFAIKNNLSNKVMVFFVQEHWNNEVEQTYKDFFEKQGIIYRNVSYHLVDFNENKQIRPLRIFKDRFKFEEYEKQKIENLHGKSVYGDFGYEYKNDCIMHYNDGSFEKSSTKKICDASSQQWKNWKCGAHFNSVYINDTLEVYNCVGKNVCFGNIQDSDFYIPSDLLTCNRETCTTKDTDLRAEKYCPQ